MKIILFFITTTASMALATFSQAQTLPAYLPSDGLVGWWPFNGNVNDESGNGNHGTNLGATLTSDRNNLIAAYLFNNDTINLSSDSFALTQFTISAWFNTSASIPAYASIFSHFVGTDPNHYAGYWIGLRADTACFFLADGTSPGLDLKSNSNLNDGNWHLITGTYSNGDAKLYIDGILKNSTNYNIILLPASTLIGNDQIAEPFVGKIDDVAFWSRALSQNEINALFTSTPINSGGGNNNTAFPNVPQGISYQAMARNAQGQPLNNTALQVKFTLLADSLTGTAEYAELHSLTTNDLGLFTTAFGTGTPLSGTFANINWAAGNKYLKVELDAGSGFVALGTQQLLSVPYSMRSNTAAKAGTIENALLPVYSDNAAALAGGLVAGQMYRTGAGVLMVVY